jgi:hypothetical protein
MWLVSFQQGRLREPINVANIQPKKKTRQKYRAQLQGLDRVSFDRLAKLIDTPRKNLGWHHDVGKNLQKLEPVQRRGAEWLINLAKTLGPSASSLRKLLKFAKLYRKPQGFKDLERAGVKWTRLRLSFPVGDRKTRQVLLRKAVKGRWSDERLRVEVQLKSKSKRRGMGGRRPSDPQYLGAEPALRKLAQLNRAWLAFHDKAWSEVTMADWKQLVHSHATNDLEKLQDLLNITHAQVTKLARACLGVRKTLQRLRQTVEQVATDPRETHL